MADIPAEAAARSGTPPAALAFYVKKSNGSL